MTRPSTFSERPGFTIVGGQPTTVGPVVTRLRASRDSFVAMRAAVGHAMTRICGMILLDETNQDDFPFEGLLDERERSAAEGILHNSHVSRLRADEPGVAEAIRRCIEVEASLLVLGSDDMAELADDPDLMTGLLEAPFDVLLLTPGDIRQPG